MAINTLDDAPPAPGIRPAWVVLLLLTGINLFNYIDRQVLAAVSPNIEETFFSGHNPFAKAKIGALQTAFIASYMLLAPVFGWLADRYSRWLLCGISVALWSLASGASGLAATFGLLMITRLFVGVGEAGYGPAAPTLIADAYPLQLRARAMSLFYLAIPVGSAMGYVLGGQIAKWFHSWRAPFIAVTFPGLLLAAACLFMRDPRRSLEVKRNSSPRRARVQDYLDLFRNRSYLLDCAGMALMTFAIGGISFWMPTYISQFRQAGDLDRVNTIFGGVVVTSGLAATLIGGWVSDKLAARFSGAYFWVSGLAIIASCPFILLMLKLPFPAAWWAIFAAVFFLFFNTGPSNTILANVTRPSVRATAFAANIFVIHLFGDAGSPPLLGGVIGDAQRRNLAFIVVVVAMAAAGVLWLWGACFLAGDTAAAGQMDLAQSDELSCI